MRRVTRPVLALACAIVVSIAAGCGNSPPNSQVKAEIEKAMVDGRKGVEARSISLGDWKNELPGMHNTTWTGTLRLTEDHGYITAIVGDKAIVKVVAKEGEEIEMSGGAMAARPEGAKDWTCGAHAENDSDSGWGKLAQKVGMPQAGYPVLDLQGNQVNTKFRGGFGAQDMFLPVSSFKPFIVEGSDEEKALAKELNDNRQKAFEAQQKLAEQRRLENERRIAEQRAEQERRLAAQKAEQDERNRLAAEKAEADRLAREEAARVAAEAARVKRLSPVLTAFKDGKGAVVVTDAGPEMGSFLYDCQVDEANFKVTGKGLDLREMPFKEFTFECTATDTNGRASFAYTRSGAEPLALGPTATGLGTRGTTLNPLSDADRAKLDALASRGRALAGAAPADLTAEVLDAEAAKARQMDMQTEALIGTIFYKARPDARLAPLFTPAGTRGNAWTAEPISIRLKEPARGKAILFKSVNPTDNLIVVVNGVHKARIARIDKAGAAMIPLPEGLEVMDLRLEAVGAASCRGIVLVK